MECVPADELPAVPQSLVAASAARRQPTRGIPKQTQGNTPSGLSVCPGPFLAPSAGMRLLMRICWTALLVAFVRVDGAIAQTPTGHVSGMVSLPSPDGQPAVLPGVTLPLMCPRVEPRIEVSGETGPFRVADRAARGGSI